MNVLSLFDGIGAGRVVLNNLNIKLDNYYSSEIDKDCIKILNNNWKDIIHLGDIKNWKNWNLDKIDLILAGSPCQDLSLIKNGNGLNGKKSSLFYEFIDIFNYYKPKYFLFENVKMKKEYENIISNSLEVKPILINSENFSAQTRERLYWTNFQFDLNLPINSDVLDNILDKDGDFDYYDVSYEFLSEEKVVCAKLDINGHDFLKRVNSRKHKCQTLTAVCGGNQEKKVYLNGKIRKLTPNEYEKLMGFPIDYTKGISKQKRYKTLGNSWQINTIEWLFKNYHP